MPQIKTLDLKIKSKVKEIDWKMEALKSGASQRETYHFI
jgi:hypothetical protein